MGPDERTETFFSTNSGVMSGIHPLTITWKTTNKKWERHRTRTNFHKKWTSVTALTFFGRLHFIWISKLAERNNCISGSLKIRLNHVYNTVCTADSVLHFLFVNWNFQDISKKSVQDLRYNCKSCEKESRWPLYLRNILN